MESVSMSPSSLPPADLVSYQQIDAFEDQLRADIHSTPPEHRLEKLEEFSERKRKIEISRPILSAAPPEYSSPPEVVPFETVFPNEDAIVIKGDVEDVLQQIDEIAQYSSPPHEASNPPMNHNKSHEDYPGAIPQAEEWKTKYPKAQIFSLDTEDADQETPSSSFTHHDDPFSLATSLNIDNDDDLLWEDAASDSQVSMQIPRSSKSASAPHLPSESQAVHRPEPHSSLLEHIFQMFGVNPSQVAPQ